jgi:hypothetical protein
MMLLALNTAVRGIPAAVVNGFQLAVVALNKEQNRCFNLVCCTITNHSTNNAENKVPKWNFLNKITNKKGKINIKGKPRKVK